LIQHSSIVFAVNLSQLQLLAYISSK